MASHEHLQQLDDDDDSSTSTSSSTSSDDDSTGVSASSVGPQESNDADSMDVDEAVAEPVAEPVKILGPPKRRIKLQLRLSKAKPAAENGDTEEPTAISQPATILKKDDADNDEDEPEEQVVKGTIVPSDDEEADVEATVVEEPPTVTAVAVPSSSSTSKPPTKPSKSRRSPTPFVQGGRPVRLPPMSSPGLLIPPTAGVFRGDADVNGFTTPASVFSRAMSLAGYTTEGRIQHPHRGSSVQRVVDDMFDSNVLFTLHFPELVPSDLWNKKLSKVKQKQQEQEPEGEEDEALPDVLIRALSKPKAEKDQLSDGDITMHDASLSHKPDQRKRKTCSFVDMAPVSLTIPYPESYIQKRLKYVQQVQARERAIVASQEASQAANDAMEAYENALAAYNSGSKRNQSGEANGTKNGPPVPPAVSLPVEIPPIPTPPSPPRLSELNGSTEENGGDSQHPIYLPKGKENFVAHLDKTCFHITDGRYFGLLSNTIADPHFVGPNAPGIGGLNLSSGATGLATSYIGSTGSSGAGSSQAYYGGSVGGGSSGGGGASSKNSGDSGKTSSKKTSAAAQGNPVATSSKVKKKTGRAGPTPTKTSSDLKRFMEQDASDLVDHMKVVIIRAAVYASRTGIVGSFVGSDRETYPDVSKAFAAHAGLRPCPRCKNNKQGAYHCRLRRKHKDADYDGGNSWEILAPLFEEKIDKLLQR